MEKRVKTFYYHAGKSFFFSLKLVLFCEFRSVKVVRFSPEMHFEKSSHLQCEEKFC